MWKTKLPIIFLFAVVASQNYGAPRRPVNDYQSDRSQIRQTPNNFRSNNAGYSQSGPVIEILRDDRSEPIDGAYNYVFETANGIQRQEQGSPTGPDGSVVQQGGWTFTFPDGTEGVFSFVADENGFRVESPLIPTPPPMPAHALAQIEKARLEDAQGRGSNDYDDYNSPRQIPQNTQFAQGRNDFNDYNSPRQIPQNTQFSQGRSDFNSPRQIPQNNQFSQGRNGYNSPRQIPQNNQFAQGRGRNDYNSPRQIPQNNNYY